MVSDVQINALKQKIMQIEKTMEDDNSNVRRNRIPARYFMFFLVIGGDDESKSILERKVRALLSNQDACEFFQITTQESGKKCVEIIEKSLKDAANSRVNVDDLNSLFICPVIFAKSAVSENLLPMLTEIDAFMDSSGHDVTWQPTIIIDRERAEYKHIYSIISEMKRFIYAMPAGKVNRCCLLSRLDENRFAVTDDSIMQTIAMMVVLQNTRTESAEGGAQTIRTSVNRTATAESTNHLFFTARNAAITNPIRSLLLQRMCSVMDYFSQKNNVGSIMPKIDYSFVTEIMGKYIAALPHNAGKITLFPLYSMMNSTSLQGQLEKIIKEKYSGVLCGEDKREIQMEKAREKFLRMFFEKGGSLEKLKTLIKDKSLEREFLQHEKDCYADIQIDKPATEKRKLSEFDNGLYKKASETCERLIRQSGWNLLQDVGTQLTRPETIRSIELVQESIDAMKGCIKERRRQLENEETVLVVGQTENRTGIDDVQRGWIEDSVRNNSKEYAGLMMRFDSIIYSMLQNNSVEDCGELLQVCYDAIRNSSYSNNDYLNRVSEECMTNEDRAIEFSSLVEKNWCYTLRFLNFDGVKDTTCIIGDANNRFCEKLRERFDGVLFDFRGLDRIDVLHISGAFSPENIFEWENIEAEWKGTQQ